MRRNSVGLGTGGGRLLAIVALLLHCALHGALCMVLLHGTVHGAWYTVHGAWYMVDGAVAWYNVHGAW